MFYSPENDAREDILTKNYPFFTQQQFVNYFRLRMLLLRFALQLDTGVARSTTVNIPTGASTIDLTTVPAEIPRPCIRSQRVFHRLLTQLQPDGREAIR